MNNIIKKWCETNQIWISDAPLILSTFAECTGRDISSDMIQKIISVSGHITVNWEYILNTIVVKKGYNVQILYDRNGQLLKRYYYE